MQQGGRSRLHMWLTAPFLFRTLDFTPGATFVLSLSNVAHVEVVDVEARWYYVTSVGMAFTFGAWIGLCCVCQQDRGDVIGTKVMLQSILTLNYHVNYENTRKRSITLCFSVLFS